MDWAKDINTFVIGGGGIRGIAMIGALEELERVWQTKFNTSIFTQIKYVAGSSIGAILALLIACRIPLEKMKDLFLSNLWNSLYQEIDFARLSVSFGLIDSLHYLLKTFEHILVRPDETFSELKARTGISLTVAVTCLDTCESEYHSDVLTPLYPVVTSILASSAMPLIFCPVEIHGKLYIDGAMLDNAPLPVHVDFSKTMFFRFCDSPLVKKPNPKPPEPNKSRLFDLHGLLQYVANVFYVTTNYIDAQQRKTLVPNEYRNRIVSFRFDNNTKSWSFHLSLKERLELIEQGKQTIQRFFDAPKIIIGELMTTLINDYLPPRPREEENKEDMAIIQVP